MELQQQIEFMDDLQTRFYQLHKNFQSHTGYDGEYGEAANHMEHVVESLWRLQGLEK